MLESARIMRRRSNEVNTRTRRVLSFFFFVFFLAVVTVASSCGGSERHADRLWRQAVQRAEQGDVQGAVDRLQKVIDQYPDTPASAKAREQIVVYRGLVAATEAYPSRRVHALMVQLARAIEEFRHDRGRLPVDLNELTPTKIASVPLDPWSRSFIYETTPRAYILKCLGADGSPGGVGDAADVVVDDGEFAKGGS